MARWTKEQKQKVLKYAEAATIREVSEKFGIPEGTIKRWRSEQRKRTEPNSKKEPKKKKPNRTKMESNVNNVEVSEDELNPELTEKQRLFCLYYIKYWNATKAYQKAYKCSYNVANAEGYKHLVKPRIKKEIGRLKKNIREGICLEAMAVLQKYIDIAFSNITDYVEFGQKEVPVIGMYGPVIDKETKKPITQIVSYVDLKPSSQVDGTIIQEVKQGKDGVSIKLSDKMKALEKLEKYFDLLPDKHKRMIEDEKLKLSREKLEIEKSKVIGDDGPTEDDGFIEALKEDMAEVWSDENGEE